MSTPTTTKKMTKAEILATIKQLSKSQGGYGRLLDAIADDESILDYLHDLNPRDPVDLVMIIEG